MKKFIIIIITSIVYIQCTSNFNDAYKCLQVLEYNCNKFKTNDSYVLYVRQKIILRYEIDF